MKNLSYERFKEDTMKMAQDILGPDYTVYVETYKGYESLYAKPVNESQEKKPSVLTFIHPDGSETVLQLEKPARMGINLTRSYAEDRLESFAIDELKAMIKKILVDPWGEEE